MFPCLVHVCVQVKGLVWFHSAIYIVFCNRVSYWHLELVDSDRLHGCVLFPPLHIM